MEETQEEKIQRLVLEKEKLKLSFKYLLIYTTIIGLITAEFGDTLASIFGLKSFYLPTSGTIIFLWIIVLISALFGSIVVHIGKALIKLNIIPLKIKHIIKSVSESSVLPLCIGSGILGLFMGLVAFLGNVLDLIFKGFGIIPLIYIGIVLTIVMGAIILAQILHFIMVSLIQE